LRDELAERLLYFRVEVIGQLMGIVAPERLALRKFPRSPAVCDGGKTRQLRATRVRDRRSERFRAEYRSGQTPPKEGMPEFALGLFR
jgi:hypothetical protein